ncbi:MAG: GAF domain-containing protein [Candidatus Coatesbacteria bacterium]|nr:GAF domain-containing protein [Candidatus Coatesbacteria bacterium]
MDEKVVEELLEEIAALTSGPAESSARLQAVCRLLAERVEHYDWVGFYLVDPAQPRSLILGPYVGAPTDHTRIPFGRGVCGRAASTGRTLEIPDVRAEDNYLACSLETRAEIVVPIFHEGGMTGQLDIDSHTAAPFDAGDRRLLAAVCRLCAPLTAER